MIFFVAIWYVGFHFVHVHVDTFIFPQYLFDTGNFSVMIMALVSPMTRIWSVMGLLARSAFA